METGGGGGKLWVEVLWVFFWPQIAYSPSVKMSYHRKIWHYHLRMTKKVFYLESLIFNN